MSVFSNCRWQNRSDYDKMSVTTTLTYSILRLYRQVYSVPSTWSRKWCTPRFSLSEVFVPFSFSWPSLTLTDLQSLSSFTYVTEGLKVGVHKILNCSCDSLCDLLVSRRGETRWGEEGVFGTNEIREKGPFTSSRFGRESWWWLLHFSSSSLFDESKDSKVVVEVCKKVKPKG